MTTNDMTATASPKANVKLDPSWLEVVGDEFNQPYMHSLKAFLKEEKRLGKTIYPAGDLIFNALNTTKLDNVKVVVLGQDPYHGPGQAHGLCFSVLPGVRVPPSLVNIFKEIQQEFGFVPPNHGYLQSWAEQGVLLLNATLTVEQAKAGSHQNKGWETFTDRIVEAVNARCNGVVFMLWGSYAQKKGRVIDSRRHLVLKSVHPSPLSAHRGFLGNGHFKAANDYLMAAGKQTVDWRLPQL